MIISVCNPLRGVDAHAKRNISVKVISFDLIPSCPSLLCFLPGMQNFLDENKVKFRRGRNTQTFICLFIGMRT